MRASVITVGNEIITGDIVDSNSKFLCGELNKLGYEIYNVISVGDSSNAIIDNIKQTLVNVDMLFITGGLGPTIDDITLECVAKALDKSLIFDNDILLNIQNRFNKLGRNMTQNNRKQAYKIEDSLVIDNNYGTASGSMISVNNKKIFVFPGPPFELKMMFESIRNYLQTENVIKSILIRCIGIGESSLETKITDIISTDEIDYGIYANKQYVDVKITAKNISESIVDSLLLKYQKLLINRLGSYVYALDKNIVEVIIDILKRKNETIAIAESCSGGMLTSMFVNVDGVSHVLTEGVVTYSNQSKVTRLGVHNESLLKYGAVSEQVAREMASGVALNLNSDLGVSITGIAGESVENNPTGLVYIGLSYRNKSFVKKLNLTGNRNTIRSLSCLNALEMIYDIIK